MWWPEWENCWSWCVSVCVCVLFPGSTKCAVFVRVDILFSCCVDFVADGVLCNLCFIVLFMADVLCMLFCVYSFMLILCYTSCFLFQGAIYSELQGVAHLLLDKMGIGFAAVEVCACSFCILSSLTFFISAFICYFIQPHPSLSKCSLHSSSLFCPLLDLVCFLLFSLFLFGGGDVAHQ